MHRFLQPDEVGAGKAGSAKQPTAMPMFCGLRSPSQNTLVPQLGQKWKRISKPLSAGRPYDLVLAVDAHLLFRPAAAVVDDRAGAPLAGLAMADIDAGRLARGDRL